MSFKIPEKVSLVIKSGESQKDFANRIFIEAARLGGLPLLQQSYFANFMIASGQHLFVGKDEKLRLKWSNDPSPKDKNPLITDIEWKSKVGKWHTHILGDFNKAELINLQTLYVISGGVLGSFVEVTPTEIITINLNVVYDPSLITSDISPQTDLEYVKQAMKPKLDYWTKTFSKIGIIYTVKYSTGKVNSTRQEIVSGALSGMVNIFYLNDPNSLIRYSKFNTGSRHIFLSELRGSILMERALCHEAGHLFGILGQSGFPPIDFLTPGVIANHIADLQINGALRQLESDNVYRGKDWIDDYINSPQQINYTPQISRLGREATRRITHHEPTIYDLFRFGARIVAKGEK